MLWTVSLLCNFHNPASTDNHAYNGVQKDEKKQIKKHIVFHVILYKRFLEFLYANFLRL